MTQIRCEVKGVFVTMNDATTVPLVVLNDGGEQSLPIFIGLWEAVSINSAKNKEILSRPFTHDLFLDLVGKFSITIHYLQIDSIEDGVYYAQSRSLNRPPQGVSGLPSQRWHCPGTPRRCTNICRRKRACVGWTENG